MAEFSACQGHRGGLASWNPTLDLIASTDETGRHVVIRDADNFEIVPNGLHPCENKIDALEWSPNGDMVMCSCYSRSLVQVFSISRPEWQCRFREALGEIIRSFWAPDSRHIVTFSNFGLYLSIWSLVTKQVRQVEYPKAGGVEFSPDGKLLTVATRKDCKDSVSIFCADTWKCLRRFGVGSTDLTRIRWAPDNSCIAIQDIGVNYMLLIYTPSGELMRRYQAYENAPGLRCLAWHPGSEYLAAGSYDQVLRLLAPNHWRCVADFKHVHPRYHRHVSNEFVCWNEISMDETALDAAGGDRHSDSLLRDEKNDITYGEGLPAVLPERQPKGVHENKLGVSLISWSFDGAYIATRNDNMPRIVWVWNTGGSFMLESILIQTNPVQHMAWSPRSHNLAISTGSSRVYLWTPLGPSWVNVPFDNFGVKACKWQITKPSEDGIEGLILLSKDRLVHVQIPISPSEPEDGGT